MSDIKLFVLESGMARELPGSAVALEKSLQTLMEHNLEALLGIRFLETEYSTGPKYGGRIDTLGIDENGSPVIIEYKRATNENVINQGLFYLDWLLDHQAEFKLLAGHANEEIIKFLKEYDADLLFIGAYGHSRIIEMVLGSTTEYVLRNSPCPVFLSR